MGFLSFLSPLAGLFTGGGKKKPSKEELLMQQLAPYLKTFSDTSSKYSAQADTDYGKASAGYDQALNYYQTLMSGNREDLLKNVDASALTKAADEQSQQNYELAPRGGRRAATAANLGFDTLSELNRYLQSLRAQAPGQVASIAQAIANMAQGKLSAAMGGASSASNILFGVEGIHQQEADRRAALLGSIFEAAGAVAGAFACNTLDTWVLTPNGYKQLKEIQVGHEVSVPLGDDGELTSMKVIRKEIKPNQDILKMYAGNCFVKGTTSHAIVVKKGADVLLGDINTTGGMELPFFIEGELKTTTVTRVELLPEQADVAILKLGDEKKNYNYITNGFISVDADCAR